MTANRSQHGGLLGFLIALGLLAAALYVLAIVAIQPDKASPAPPTANATQTAETTPDATASAFPIPTVPEPSSSDTAAGLEYYCGNGEPFHVESLMAELASANDPAFGILSNGGAPPFALQSNRWWLVYRSATTAQFVGMTTAGTYEYVVVKLATAGDWRISGAGDCQIKYLSTGRTTLSWWIDPANPPAADARQIRVIAIDPCQSQPLLGRVDAPIIRYGPESVLVVLTAAPGAPTGDICMSGPSISLAVKLDQPLGGRALLDGGTWPSRDASVPAR